MINCLCKGSTPLVRRPTKFCCFDWKKGLNASPATRGENKDVVISGSGYWALVQSWELHLWSEVIFSPGVDAQKDTWAMAECLLPRAERHWVHTHWTEANIAVSGKVDLVWIRIAAFLWSPVEKLSRDRSLLIGEVTEQGASWLPEVRSNVETLRSSLH